jgi:S1-C subfamily serine protease
MRIRYGTEAGQEIEVSRPVSIGREDDCDITLTSDGEVSRRHAVLEPQEDGRVLLRDLGSTNGTFVNGRRVTEPVLLDGSEDVRVGDTHLVLVTDAPAAAAAPQSDAPAAAAAPQSDAAEAAPAPAPAAASPAPKPAEPQPLPPVPPSASRLERVMLRRQVSLLTKAVVGVGIVAVIAIALVVVNPFGGGDDDEDRTAADVADAITPSTVLIFAGLTGSDEGSKGTGWVLDADEGLIVTNNHVVKGGDQHTVGTSTEDRKPAELVATAPCEDLALLKVKDTAGLKELKLGSQAELRRGESVVAVGYPVNASLDDPLTVTSGGVSVVKSVYENQEAIDVPRLPNVIQTDTAINPGNSGGPLVNFENELVGVNTATFNQAGGRQIQGQSYAIGVDRVKEVLGELRKGNGIGWAGLIYGHDEGPGLKVVGGHPGTAAEKAGLKPGVEWRLLAIDGKRVDNTMRSYCEAMKDTGRTGQSATFTLAQAPVSEGSSAQNVRMTFE